MVATNCGDKPTAPRPVPPPPPPGNAVVALTTPNITDGAIIVTLQGPDLSTVQASNAAFTMFSRLVSAQEARVTIVGDLTAAPLFTFKLGAGQLPSAYTATVQQVANRSDLLRASTNGYQLTITAAP